jgi:hypothetical protein
VTALRYREGMRGWVSFHEVDANLGLWQGRAEGGRCAFAIEVDVADLDAFVDRREHVASVTGTLDVPELGGRLEVHEGSFNLLRQVGGPRHRRMEYVLKAKDAHGRRVRLDGFKDVQDDWFRDAWNDTSTLFATLRAGWEPDDPALATGILRIGRLAFGRTLLCMRTSGAPRWRRWRSLARYARLFAGGLVRVYVGPNATEGQPDFPAELAGTEAFQGHEPGRWHPCPGRPRLQRRILGFRALDDVPLTVHNIRADPAVAGPPVLVAAGTGVRAEITYGAPIARSLIDELVDDGHDVWVVNWRASIDLPVRSFTLDDAAACDWPASVATILRLTGAGELKAVVHCQGSTSFSMALVAGLLPEVTTVVANAVSLHVDVPAASRRRMVALVPLMKHGYRGLDPQWAIRPTGLRARLYAWIGRHARRDCGNPVCMLANYVYGVTDDVLWRHENLSDATHRWIAREFGWVPVSFFAQMRRCAVAGHLVRVTDRPQLPAEVTDGPPRTRARWTLIAGQRNECFLPSGQVRTGAWLREQGATVDAVHVVPGFSHLDIFFGERADRDVFPLIAAALRR